MAEKVVRHAEKALKKVEDQLECAICLQSYTDPKLLPCFHVFCKHCLERIVVRNQDGSTVTCPKCRRSTPLPEKGVAALQSAFHVHHLFDIRDTLEKVKEPQKTQCEKCNDAIATGFCRDCAQFVCKNCTKIHQIWKEFTKHQIVSFSEVQKEASSLAPPTKKVLYCSKHPENVLKIYCETCKELICNDCTIRLHQGHQYNLVADTFPKHKAEILGHLQPVRQHLGTVNKALGTLDTRSKEIGDQRMNIETDIHKRIDRVHQALDQRRAELVGQLDQLTQQKLKSLAAQKDKIQTFQVQLTSCLEYVEGSLTTSTPAEILAMKEPAIKQIQGIATNISPDSLVPKEKANMKLVADNLEQQCHEYGMILADDPKVDPTQCHVTGNGSKQATAGEQASLILQTVDQEGKGISIPVKDVSAELVHSTDHTTVKCEVTRKGKGKYTVTYTPATRGKHQLHIKVAQMPIGCSPLPVVVKLPPQRLGNPVRTFGNLVDPRGVAVNNKGQILVSKGSQRNHISVFSPEGQKIQSFGKINTPWGICFDSDNNILVAGHLDNQIHKFTPNGEHVTSVGTLGTNPLQFRSPIGIAFSSKNGKIYVSEHGNDRIQVLNKDLTFSATFGSCGSGNGQLSGPWGLAVDSSGNVYVADYYNHRIQVFTPEGRFVRAIGSQGTGPGQLSCPADVYVDGTDIVYVADCGNGRISVFTAQGQFLTSFGQGHLSRPHGLTMNENGFVIVANYSNQQVQIF